MTTSRGTVLLIAAVLLGGCGGGDGTSKHTIGGSLSGHAATGKATTWNPNASGVVRALAVEGTTIYVAGGFSSIGGQVRNRIAALDTASGIATGWDPNANGFVYALAVDAATVNAGGDFTTIGDEPAGGFAVFEK